MSQFRKHMAHDLLLSGVDLDNQDHCAMALLASGWRGIHINEWLDDAIRLARTFATAQDRETIERDMAKTLSCDDLAADSLTASNLPGGSALDL